jgi:hypothetical protein
VELEAVRPVRFDPESIVASEPLPQIDQRLRVVLRGCWLSQMVLTDMEP